MNEDILEDIAHQKALLGEHKKHLKVLERQAAKFGLYVPPYIQIEIDEITEKINNINITIHRLEFEIKRGTIEHINANNASRIRYITRLNLYPSDNFAWSPDGLSIAVACKEGVQLYDTVTFSPFLLIERNTKGYPGLSMTFSHDGNLVAAAGNDTINLWRTNSGDLFNLFRGDDIAFSPDGNLIAIHVKGRGISVLRLADNHQVWSIKSGRSPVFSPDGTLLATVAANYHRHDVALWSTNDGSQVRTFSVPKSINATFSLDGTLLAAGSADYPSQIWQISDGKLIQTIYSGGIVAFNTDGTLLHSNHSIVRLSDGQGIKNFDFERKYSVLTHVAFSPDGRFLGLALCDYINEIGEVQLWGL